MGIVEESQAGRPSKLPGRQKVNPDSCIVAGRGLRPGWGVGDDHISNALDSAFIVNSVGFIVDEGNERGGSSLLNLLSKLNVKDGPGI